MMSRPPVSASYFLLSSISRLGLTSGGSVSVSVFTVIAPSAPNVGAESVMVSDLLAAKVGLLSSVMLMVFALLSPSAQLSVPVAAV